MIDRPPYLSVVVTARNDDHGGNPLHRTQLFLNGLLEQADRFRLPTELILVEWNPPQDRPRLKEVLSWPATQGYCSVRIVEVPNELHNRLEYSDRLPLYQMIGKNVGIRRARGEFVLATNIDILFSDGLMRTLARRRLTKGVYYRADRHDVPPDISPDWPLDRRLRSCADNVIRINMAGGTLDTRTGDFYWIYPESRRIRRLMDAVRNAVLRHVPGALPFFDARLARRSSRSRRSKQFREDVRATWKLMRYAVWRVYAFVYWFVAGFRNPRLVPMRIKRRLRRLLAAGAAAAPRGAAATVRRHPFQALLLPVAVMRALSRAVRRKLLLERRDLTRELARIRLHTNASGDFTLLAREDWFRVRGYAELQMYSMHIDGLILYEAYYNGIRERILPYAIYHLEHAGGFRPEEQGKSHGLDAQLERRAIPQLSTDQLVNWILQMYETKEPMQFNDQDWGFAAEELDEDDPYAVSSGQLVGRASEARGES